MTRTSQSAPRSDWPFCIFVCMWNVDHNSRIWKKDTGTGDDKFQQTPKYLIQRSHNQWGSVSQNWKRHRAIWQPPDFSEKTQTEVVWACHTIIWTGQDCPTGNSSSRENEEADRRNDGKTTSKRGLALNGISYYRKLRTTRSGGSWL